ncbi:hypothetical protein E2C01_084654 [Portunus trituberculatus]|uniref:Uncharacterized protein n=1 Tax=Portunus trituberculatus TaxID=210409 RepID=A0A5B7J8B3_PORTR|nr:hypothetical protein [Portunus trituberculatus]
MWCKNKIRVLLEKVEVRRAMGPDILSGWTMRECREQLVELICDAINNSNGREGTKGMEKSKYNLDIQRMRKD